MMHRSKYLSLAIASVALGATCFAPAQSAPATGIAPRMPKFNLVATGVKAPDFTVYTPDDQPVSLSQFKGKVVILDFWATWCGPCKVSMPGLEKIYSQVKGQGVVVLSVNTWDQKPDFKTWVAKNSGVNYQFTFVRDPAEGDHATIRKESIAKRLYKVPGIPTMYVIGRDGKIAAGFVGSGNEANLTEALGKLGIKTVTP